MKALPIILIMALASTLTLAQPASGAQIGVGNGMIKISSARYEIAFSSANGSVAYILDPATHQTISTGSAGGNLWTATLDNDQRVTSNDAAFSYDLDAAKNLLRLTYTGDISVIVTVNASDGAALKLQAAVSNHSGHAINQFGFPSDLALNAADVQDALLPMMPGALINASFFGKGMTFSDQYPGVMFADYLAVRSSSGQIALYAHGSASLSTGALVQPVFLGFGHAGESATITHNFKTWIGDGESWSTPAVIVRVGQDYPETIAQYRSDNGIDQYRSLADKLGDAAPSYFAAPMYKLDLQALRLSFADVQTAIIDRLNLPGMIHFVALESGGFDNSYPDFIPPDPKWGTTEQLAALVSAIHQAGGIVVPYTNFSWWDNYGPTLTNLPADVGLNDVIVTDAHGLPDFETYGAHSGFVVDPNAAFVQNKISEQHDALLHSVGVDGVFEDQWGARSAPYDFNASALARDDAATAYFEGVLDHYRAHAASRLMTEVGVDVLANNGVGFMGTNTLWDMLGYRTTAAYTTYYPMAAMLLRDKVLLYQHDLAAQTWTKNRDMLRWNLAQGYNLSNAFLDETIPGLNMDNPWLNVIGVFQRYALANYADELAQSYDDLSSGVTRTTFSSYTVYANWDTEHPFSRSGYTLPPGGVVTEANDGSVTAGVFTGYNGQPLSDGDHYLVEARTADDIRVFQPLGADTTLHIHLPTWSSVTVTATRYDGTPIAAVEATVSGSDLAFSYQSSVQATPVGYYRIAAAQNS